MATEPTTRGRRKSDLPDSPDTHDSRYWHLDREVADLKNKNSTLQADMSAVKADVASIKTSLDGIAAGVRDALEQSKPKQQNVWQVVGGVIALTGALAAYVTLTQNPLETALGHEQSRLNSAFTALEHERTRREELQERMARREARAEVTESFLADGLNRLRIIEIKNGHGSGGE